MAYIGIKNAVIAKIKEEEPGKEVVYDTGMVFGKTITANIAPNNASTTLDADDVVTEVDNSMTGGTAEMNLADIDEDVKAYALGYKVVEVDVPGAIGNKKYVKTSKGAPYVGFGFLRTRVLNGVKSYKTYWYHKALFALGSISAQTKGQSVSWQTPIVSGQIMAVQNDADLTDNYYDELDFEKLADAIAYLKTKANIETTAGQGGAE